MFGNYLAAALRNLARNKLYAAISIVGLAVGMAAAILTGLYIRDELTFDHFIPGHENVYVLISHTGLPGRPEQVADGVLPQIAGWMKLDFPQVLATTRLIPTSGLARPSVRRGEVEAVEDHAWIDANFFQVLPIRPVAGRLDAPLPPQSVVIDRTTAHKYFGDASPVGELLELDRDKPFRVAAVIEDLPANSHLNMGIFAYSTEVTRGLGECDSRPYVRGTIGFCGRAYVRFSSARAAAEVQARLNDLVTRRIAPTEGPGLQFWNSGVSYGLKMVPMDQLHFVKQSVTRFAALNRQGSTSTLWSLGAIAVLILVIAGVNFVNLMTARATRRAVEVGVRKASGAEQGHLVVQFLGESLIYAVLGMVVAAALVELLLPALNAALQRTMIFDYWRDPRLILGMAGLTLTMGLAAGLYPAFVLSSFRPSHVLKGGAPLTSGSAAVREGLVVAQFAILIALVIASAVIYRQTQYVMGEGLRLDTDQMLTADMRCTKTFVDRVQALPGVKGAACSGPIYTVLAAEGTAMVKGAMGEQVAVSLGSIDFGFLELYGVRPLAGRLFARQYGADVAPPPAANGPIHASATVINQAAVRALGYTSSGAALGKRIDFFGAAGGLGQVVGVIPDFSIDLLHGPVKPTAFIVFPPAMQSLNVKLEGRRIPDALKALDRLWKETGQPRAMQRRFVAQYLQSFYVGTIREGMLVGALAAIAVFIAVLGLFGLAAFTAERRTKEIGVRKAMGASTRDILQLLLWQFSKPVLWANLIAWPAAWWAMEHWLQGFALRIALQPELFVTAALAALLIAWVTVFSHALKVARDRPILALRYE